MPEIPENDEVFDQAWDVISQRSLWSFKVRFLWIIWRGTDEELIDFLAKYRKEHL
jgi:hypothetical protein